MLAAYEIIPPSSESSFDSSASIAWQYVANRVWIWCRSGFNHFPDISIVDLLGAPCPVREQSSARPLAANKIWSRTSSPTMLWPKPKFISDTRATFAFDVDVELLPLSWESCCATISSHPCWPLITELWWPFSGAIPLRAIRRGRICLQTTKQEEGQAWAHAARMRPVAFARNLVRSFTTSPARSYSPLSTLAIRSSTHSSFNINCKKFPESMIPTSLLPASEASFSFWKVTTQLVKQVMASSTISGSFGSGEVAEAGTVKGRSSDLRAPHTAPTWCISGRAP